MFLQYFERRLNGTEVHNGTGRVQKEYLFNSWMTLLSQLPLLLFTLLNSMLYQWSVALLKNLVFFSFFKFSLWNHELLLRFRISEKVRIAGSLVLILLLFIFTAALVKVQMGEDRFFSVTMATIWFINCEWAWPGGRVFVAWHAVFVG